MNWLEEISIKEKALIIAALLTAGFLLMWLMYDFVLPFPLFALLYFPAKKIYLNYQNARIRSSFETQFNDFLYYISISFSVGRNMIQAMEEAMNNLKEIYGEDSLMAKYLEGIITENRQSNTSEMALLNDFASSMKNEDIKDFVDVYDNCKETGGDMVYAINSASQVIGEKIAITREIKSLSSQKKMEGRIIAMMPFLIILFLKLTGPDYLEILYSSLAGRIIMTLTLVAVFISWILVDRITRVKI